MGDAAIRTVVEAIHSSPTQAVVYLCGGASLVSLSLFMIDSYIHKYVIALCF